MSSKLNVAKEPISSEVSGVFVGIPTACGYSVKLFVITNYDGGIYGIFIDLQKAKEKLHEIYKKTPDFKYYGYKINEYSLFDGEYILSSTIENIFS